MDLFQPLYVLINKQAFCLFSWWSKQIKMQQNGCVFCSFCICMHHKDNTAHYCQLYWENSPSKMYWILFYFFVMCKPLKLMINVWIAVRLRTVVLWSGPKGELYVPTVLLTGFRFPKHTCIAWHIVIMLWNEGEDTTCWCHFFHIWIW